MLLLRDLPPSAGDHQEGNSTPPRFAGFQFGLFHLFAVMTIAAMTLAVLRVVELPPLFLAMVGGYLALYAIVRGPFLAIKLSRLWQRRQQLLVERQRLERQLLEALRARRDDTPADQSSDDGRSRNKVTL
jgi:hypothetical protein